MVRRYALIKKGVLIIILATYYEVVVCYHNYIANFGTVLYHQYFNFTGKCQNGRWMAMARVYVGEWEKWRAVT